MAEDPETEIFLRSLEATEDGGMRMCFAPGAALQMFTSEMVQLLKVHNNAPNYVEVQVIDNDTGQEWMLLVQKADGLTPGNKAHMEKIRADRFRAALEQIRDTDPSLSHAVAAVQMQAIATNALVNP